MTGQQVCKGHKGAGQPEHGWQEGGPYCARRCAGHKGAAQGSTASGEYGPSSVQQCLPACVLPTGAKPHLGGPLAFLVHRQACASTYTPLRCCAQAGMRMHMQHPGVVVPRWSNACICSAPALLGTGGQTYAHMLPRAL